MFKSHDAEYAAKIREARHGYKLLDAKWLGKTTWETQM
jgi:hypothetical protein